MNVRLPPAELAPLDAWISELPDDPKPSRPEAIRQVLEMALNQETLRRYAAERNLSPKAAIQKIIEDGLRVAEVEAIINEILARLPEDDTNAIHLLAKMKGR